MDNQRVTDERSWGIKNPAIAGDKVSYIDYLNGK
jgi:hypothetical protein